MKMSPYYNREMNLSFSFGFPGKPSFRHTGKIWLHFKMNTKARMASHDEKAYIAQIEMQKNTYPMYVLKSETQHRISASKSLPC